MAALQGLLDLLSTLMCVKWESTRVPYASSKSGIWWVLGALMLWATLIVVTVVLYIR